MCSLIWKIARNSTIALSKFFLFFNELFLLWLSMPFIAEELTQSWELPWLLLLRIPWIIVSLFQLLLRFLLQLRTILALSNIALIGIINISIDICLLLLFMELDWLICIKLFCIFILFGFVAVSWNMTIFKAMKILE